MEKKQGGGGGVGRSGRGGFFSALKSEVVRGLSPLRSRPSQGGSSFTSASSAGSCRSRSASPMSLFRRRRGTTHAAVPEMLFVQPRSLSGIAEAPIVLSPLQEGPDEDGYVAGPEGVDLRGRGRRQMSWSSSRREGSGSSSDLRLLLGVLGAPLAPVHVSSLQGIAHLSIKSIPID